jgi:hypothetical protein
MLAKIAHKCYFMTRRLCTPGSNDFAGIVYELSAKLLS